MDFRDALVSRGLASLRKWWKYQEPEGESAKFYEEYKQKEEQMKEKRGNTEIEKMESE
jgi:hypothetical protein